jgi:hypothetical protein
LCWYLLFVEPKQKKNNCRYPRAALVARVRRVHDQRICAAHDARSHPDALDENNNNNNNNNDTATQQVLDLVVRLALDDYVVLRKRAQTALASSVALYWRAARTRIYPMLCTALEGLSCCHNVSIAWI